MHEKKFAMTAFVSFLTLIAVASLICLVTSGWIQLVLLITVFIAFVADLCFGMAWLAHDQDYPTSPGWKNFYIQAVRLNDRMRGRR